MGFKDRAKKLFNLKLAYYDDSHIDEYEIKNNNIETLEEEIVFLINAFEEPGLLEFVALETNSSFNMYLIKRLQTLINAYNDKDRLYNYIYNSESRKYTKIKTRYTGYYNGKKYYNGIEILGEEKDDAPNIGIKH